MTIYQLYPRIWMNASRPVPDILTEDLPLPTEIPELE
jgi:hypothetical protein